MINCIILAGGNSISMTFPKEYIEIEEKYLIHNSIEILKNLAKKYNMEILTFTVEL